MATNTVFCTRRARGETQIVQNRGIPCLSVVKPLVRFEGLPGEFSQHDFGQVDVEFIDGSTRRIHFFASRLKYSRSIRVSLVKDEAVESLVRHLAEHLDSWDGVPLLCVFDRPKTVALKWLRNGEVTE
jgi:transposase